MTTILNLTPHPIVLLGEDDTVLAEFAPAGPVARAAQTDEVVGSLEVADGMSVDLVRSRYGAPTDLPDPEEEVFCVVSVLTAQAASAHGRSTGDLLITSGPVRDDAGRIVGCRRFALL